MSIARCEIPCDIVLEDVTAGDHLITSISGSEFLINQNFIRSSRFCRCNSSSHVSNTSSIQHHRLSWVHHPYGSVDVNMTIKWRLYVATTTTFLSNTSQLEMYMICATSCLISSHFVMVFLFTVQPNTVTVGPWPTSRWFQQTEREDSEQTHAAAVTRY
jgi:hypothetical protein